MADLLTNGGKGVITNALVNAAAPPKNGMWGTSSGQTAASTALAVAAAPTTTTAVAGTATQQTVTTSNDTYQVVVTITAGGALAITEFALTTNTTISSGTMFNYHSFAAINLANGDSIQFTDQTTFS